MKKDGKNLIQAKGRVGSSKTDTPSMRKVRTMGGTGGTISPSGTDMVRGNTKGVMVTRKMDYGQK